MKLIVEIPKEFEDHFNNDRFEDSLHRLSADAHLLAGNYEQETAKMLIEAFKNADDGSCNGCKYDEVLADRCYSCARLHPDCYEVSENE